MMSIPSRTSLKQRASRPSVSSYAKSAILSQDKAAPAPYFNLNQIFPGASCACEQVPAVRREALPALAAKVRGAMSAARPAPLSAASSYENEK
jgi:hypothetical protein